MLLTFVKVGLPAIVAVLYIITGGAYFYDKQIGAAVMWTAYALAQVGILLALKGI